MCRGGGCEPNVAAISPAGQLSPAAKLLPRRRGPSTFAMQTALFALIGAGLLIVRAAFERLGDTKGKAGLAGDRKRM